MTHPFWLGVTTKNLDFFEIFGIFEDFVQRCTARVSTENPRVNSRTFLGPFRADFGTNNRIFSTVFRPLKSYNFCSFRTNYM